MAIKTTSTHASRIQDNDAKGRPVSPHVTIYAFPIAAITSVTHRVTGGLLAIGMYGIGITEILGGDAAAVFDVLGSSAIAPLAKFSVAFPLVFHTLAGIRHMYWERYPDGLNPESQRQASLALIGSSSALSFLAMLF